MYKPENRIEKHENNEFPLSIYKLSNKIGLLPHYHNNFEIIYIKKGELNITIGQNTYHAKEGTIFFLSMYQVHSTCGVEGKRCIFYAIVFDTKILDMINTNSYYIDFIKPFINGSMCFPECITRENSIHKKLEESVILMIQEYYNKKPAYEIYITTAIERLFAAFIRYMGTYNTDVKKFSYSNKKLLDDMISYIEMNYMKEITLNDISAYLNISKHYLCRVVKKLTGKSFTQLLNMYRVKQAEILLKNHQISVFEVAERSGFRNLSYFNRVFLKYTGNTPSKSRK